MCTAEAVPADDDASGFAGDPASGRPRTDTAATFTVAAPVFRSTPEALRIAGAALDYLNAAAGNVVAGNVVAGNTAAACDAAPVSLDGTACGEVLIALGEIQAKLTAAHAGFLRRFDAADAHDADGYGTSSSWLAAKAGLSKKAAKEAVRQMRQLRDRPLLDGALAAGDITDSLAFEIAGWTRKLPATMREETDKILLQAHAAGASLDDLATIAACAIERWRQQQPDPEPPDDGFDDRFVQAGTTFGGAGIIRGNLTPECATAVRAVLEALGKKAGPDDERTEGKRFHDALQLACELLLRARLVPDRAGACTQAIVHIPLSQLRAMPGAADLEYAWIKARSGEDGYLTGPGAQAAACDAQSVPVVTATINPDVIDQIIDLARTPAGVAHPAPLTTSTTAASAHPRPPGPSPQARQALRHAIARLAIDLVSGPAGIAAALRQGLLDKPWNTPSLPLDIGHSRTIPGHIRRAVLLRDRHCAWPQCDRRAAWCDIHHLTHQADGGETSLANCVLLCQYHHDIAVHRHGWTLTLHPDGTTQATSPDRRHTLHSHAPPGPQTP